MDVVDAGNMDARVRRSRERVLAASFDLLSEGGVGGFSVDEVSRRSGVAKTTIYRHWPSREALVLEAAARISAQEPVPDTGTLEGDLTALLVSLGAKLTSARWSSVVPSLVDIAERDADFAALHSRIQRGHASSLRAVLERAVERAELPADADVPGLISALIGPLYYRRWFSREPIDAPFVTLVVDGVLGGGVRPAARRPRDPARPRPGPST
ncbi:TetR family transcriptional regulator [Solirubrobacter pauli]|uniref:TetR family transcriptional regulator n=1 Tax=Solirubrobacter pauli TaxID=166793 RepID=A0A660KWK3_9ACTN|nr:TetR/AcrR family transcriptional regulator [Solirubrobacter pauli]RKQ84825.1 TetR family transcriptional regulator [Solirubrobacter pauli]